MKYFIVSLLFGLVTLTWQRHIQYSRPEKEDLMEYLRVWKHTVEEHFTSCLCESKDKAEYLYDFFNMGLYSNDPCFKCALKCAVVRGGYISNDGKYNTTLIASVVPETTIKYIEGCTKTSNDLCENVYQFTACMYKYILEHLKLTPSEYIS